MALIVQAVGATQIIFNDSDIIPVLPTHIADDLLMVWCCRIDTATQLPGTLTTASGGWARRHYYRHTNASNENLAGAWFWKKAASGSEANPTIDDDGDTTVDMMAVALTLRGQDLTTPFDAADTENDNPGGATATADALTITSVTDGALSLIGVNAFDNPTYSNPTTGWVIEAQDQTATETDKAFAVLSNTIESKGATGLVTVDQSVSAHWTSIHLMIRPASLLPNPSVSDAPNVTDFDKQNLLIMPKESN